MLRASRSGLVTVRASSSRKKARHSLSFVRCATLDACSLNTFSASAAFQRIADNPRPPPFCPVCVRDNT